MFARKVKNRSGSVSVQVISKEGGRYRVIRTVGTSKDADEIERLWRHAEFVACQGDASQGRLFGAESLNDQVVQRLMESLSNGSIRIIGPELIFGTLFDRIGLKAIPDELFRHLVISRLAYPTSKLKTVDYLYRYKGVRLSVSALYRSLDRLHSRYKAQVEEIVYRHTRKRLGSVSVVLYDITTLYFESEDEDDLRKLGYSKDGKHQHPQILLGLLVGPEGLPIGYDFFEGNRFEGHTLLPVLQQLQRKCQLQRPIVVADAAMLSKANLAQLSSADYPFIVGARIKNEEEKIKQEIIQKASEMRNGDHRVLNKGEPRLIITYSDKRAGKDAQNRKRGLLRLQKQVKSGRLTKENINNRGYNKFLTLQGEVAIRIDEAKVQEDQQWDGLKGYLTNTQLKPEEVTEHYSHLWQIEKAFRISKTDLRIRPIYHYRHRRIEAHLCIAFAAYSIYKELELLLKDNGIKMSAKRAAELTQNMYELHYALPDSGQLQTIILNMDPEQQLLFNCVHHP